MNKLVNHYYFDTKGPEQAYWAGFLYGDGCINYRKGRNQPSISLKLATKDKDHVYAFRDAVSANYSDLLIGINLPPNSYHSYYIFVKEAIKNAYF